jgi:16S rRNA (cytosine1402-N4)-methyltransferase
MEYHKPVLLAETIAHLNIKKGNKYIDATLGEGGHTLEILKQGGLVLGLEVDAQSLEKATSRISDAGFGSAFTGCLGNFRNIQRLADKNDYTEVAGILYDLGYSSGELEREDLGLSFIKDQPLDMRLDRTLGVTAADLVNSLPEDQLSQIIFNYSDERLARRYAKAIVQSRALKKIQTTADLANLLASEAPSNYEGGRIHPATRTFQALRIAVNCEIENLIESLPQAARLLMSGGRLLVISFHSLEDRTVKQFGRSARPTLNEIVEKPVVPTPEEIGENNRSRSAKLRVFEKL